MRVRERKLDVPHLRIAARAWGDPALPPLLALHGWLDNAASFDTLAPLLAGDFHVVAIDLPGHGRSAHRPRGSGYHFVDYLPDIASTVDVLGWSSFVLIGHSLGAALASVFAALYPERVTRLALIEMLGPIATSVDQTAASLRRALEAREENRKAPLRVFPDIEAAVAARQKVSGLSESAARALVTRGVIKVAGGYSWSSDPRLTLPSLQRYTEDQILNLIDSLSVPTQLILAEPATAPLSVATLATRTASVSNLRISRLAGNHHLHLENPLEVAAAILEFLGSQVLKCGD